MSQPRSLELSGSPIEVHCNLKLGLRGHFGDYFALLIHSETGLRIQMSDVGSQKSDVGFDHEKHEQTDVSYQKSEISNY